MARAEIRGHPELSLRRIASAPRGTAQVRTIPPTTCLSTPEPDSFGALLRLPNSGLFLINPTGRCASMKRSWGHGGDHPVLIRSLRARGQDAAHRPRRRGASLRHRLKKIIQRHDFTSMRETVNALEAWFGSLQCRACGRREAPCELDQRSGSGRPRSAADCKDRTSLLSRIVDDLRVRWGGGGILAGRKGSGCPRGDPHAIGKCQPCRPGPVLLPGRRRRNTPANDAADAAMGGTTALHDKLADCAGARLPYARAR